MKYHLMSLFQLYFVNITALVQAQVISDRFNKIIMGNKVAYSYSFIYRRF